MGISEPGVHIRIKYIRHRFLDNYPVCESQITLFNLHRRTGPTSDKTDIILLAFGTYGGFADCTAKFL